MCGHHKLCSHVTTSKDCLVDTRKGESGTETYFAGLAGLTYQSIFPPYDAGPKKGEPL